MTAHVPPEFADLLNAPIGALATIGPDGHPQVTAIGFLNDPVEGVVRVSLNDSRQKTRNLRRDSRATLFIVDPASVYRSLEIRAEAELAPDEDFAFAKIAGAKYGEDFHDRDLPGETRSIVTLRPLKVNATDVSP